MQHGLKFSEKFSDAGWIAEFSTAISRQCGDVTAGKLCFISQNQLYRPIPISGAASHIDERLRAFPALKPRRERKVYRTRRQIKSACPNASIGLQPRWTERPPYGAGVGVPAVVDAQKAAAFAAAFSLTQPGDAAGFS